MKALHGASAGFDLDAFIAAPRAAAAGERPGPAVHALLEQALAGPEALCAALPDPADGDETLLFDWQTGAPRPCTDANFQALTRRISSPARG